MLLLVPGYLAAQACMSGVGPLSSSHGLSGQFISKEHSRGFGASVWMERPAGRFLRAGATVLRPRRTSLTEVNLDVQLGKVLHPSGSREVSLCPSMLVGAVLLDGGLSWRTSVGLLSAFTLARPSSVREVGLLTGAAIEYARTSLESLAPEAYGSFDLGAFYRFSRCVASAAVGQLHMGRDRNDPSVRLVASLCL
jgi:hypothetical protein